MPHQIRIRPAAEADIQDAYEYYELCRKGLGRDFILCIDEALDKISQNPEQFPVVHKEIRRILVKRFPFGLFFILKENTVVVLAILHGSRNPRNWKQRS